jgi:hypothetical protein
MMENSVEAPKKRKRKLKIELPYPTISLLGMYSKDVSRVTTKAPAHPCLLKHNS